MRNTGLAPARVARATRAPSGSTTLQPHACETQDLLAELITTKRSCDRTAAKRRPHTGEREPGDAGEASRE